MQPARIMMRKTQIRFMWSGGIVTYKCFARITYSGQFSSATVLKARKSFE